MEVKLTRGAVTWIINREVSSEKELKPVLQVIELKEIQTSMNPQQQQQESKKNERFRLVLSDGLLKLQGMLGTSMNQFVKSSKLQIGSIVHLTQYICNIIQDRMIVIIFELEVLVETYDIIGKPVPAPKYCRLTQVHIDQPGTVMAQTNCLRENSVSGSMADKLNSIGTTLQQPRMNQFHGSSYPNKSEPLKYPATNSPVVNNEAPPGVIPISALNPYQGRWIIKGRVTMKGALRHYNNTRGEGKLFSFDLLDSDGGEIRVTCFNVVADQFYNQIEAGKVYLISRGSLKPAQKEFNHLNNNYEIVLDRTSIIQLCFEDDNNIPWQNFHFQTISDVEGMENDSIVDIIGVVLFISPVASIMRKSGTETQKRTLHLKDMSGRSIELTLWGDFCNDEGHKLQSLCDSGEFPVLAVKTCKVNDFNGKAVGTVSTSQLFIDPDFTEAHMLKKWFVSEGRNTPVSISRKSSSSVSRGDNRKTISQIKDEKLGTSEKTEWITVVATVMNIKLDSLCYKACPIMIGNRQCNKKVKYNVDGKWWCDECDRSVDKCDYRYIIQFQIQDHTGKTWVTAFQELCEDLVGVSAKDLYYLRYENQNDEKFMELMRQVMFNDYVFKLKVKEETFSDEQHMKSTVVKVEKADFSSNTRYFLDLIYKIKANDYGPFVSKAEIGTRNLGMDYAGMGTDGSKHLAPAAAWRENGVPAANRGSQGGNQYSGSRLRETASSMDVFCKSSGVNSLSSTNYPIVKNDLVQSIGRDYTDRISSRASVGRTSDVCYKCHQTGHWAKDCPRLECYKCHQTGHWAKDCPRLDRPSYGST